MSSCFARCINRLEPDGQVCLRRYPLTLNVQYVTSALIEVFADGTSVSYVDATLVSSSTSGRRLQSAVRPGRP